MLKVLEQCLATVRMQHFQETLGITLFLDMLEGCSEHGFLELFIHCLLSELDVDRGRLWIGVAHDLLDSPQIRPLATYWVAKVCLGVCDAPFRLIDEFLDHPLLRLLSHGLSEFGHSSAI